MNCNPKSGEKRLSHGKFGIDNTADISRRGENRLDNRSATPPILRGKHYDQPSVFVPDNLLREARRQKALPDGRVPAVCVLDPDGDIVRTLRANNRATKNPYWACYHTDMYGATYDDLELGLIGCAVGSSFAVLVAEQLFASGCELLISVTSSGQITTKGTPPYFVLITHALRDEGTSYHYLPPSDYAYLQTEHLQTLQGAFDKLHVPVHWGATWTTDAPFRETEYAIEQARLAELLAVEMEAAALYAFAQARQCSVICFAHVTNQMGNIEGDFEKGEENGSRDALELIHATAVAWLLAKETQPYSS